MRPGQIQRATMTRPRQEDRDERMAARQFPFVKDDRQFFCAEYCDAELGVGPVSGPKGGAASSAMQAGVLLQSISVGQALRKHISKPIVWFVCLDSIAQKLAGQQPPPCCIADSIPQTSRVCPTGNINTSQAIVLTTLNARYIHLPSNKAPEVLTSVKVLQEEVI